MLYIGDHSNYLAPVLPLIDSSEATADRIDARPESIGQALVNDNDLGLLICIAFLKLLTPEKPDSHRAKVVKTNIPALHRWRMCPIDDGMVRNADTLPIGLARERESVDSSHCFDARKLTETFE